MLPGDPGPQHEQDARKGATVIEPLPTRMVETTLPERQERLNQPPTVRRRAVLLPSETSSSGALILVDREAVGIRLRGDDAVPKLRCFESRRPEVLRRMWKC